MSRYRTTGEVLRELARHFARFGLGVGGVVAAALYGLGMLLAFPLGLTALVMAMAGVLLAGFMWAGAGDAATATAAETGSSYPMVGDSGGGVDPEAAAWSDIITEMQVLALITAGVAFYGFVAIFVFVPGG